ncbi:hypothetical protein [Azospirillum sp.]|uniref:hypothetical protein n=1 Tax=Azospirillum sp. TaxID=34012 RepID=UPI002D37E1C8|nr:hypothetical protein [Azospirillum sp.]HYD69266.1 hypothetical protein [Azospirillum sp.]
MISRFSIPRPCLVVLLSAALAGSANAADSSFHVDYITMQKWLQAAEDAANEHVTYEICGWGSIDLLTPFLAGAVRQGVDALMWDELTRRYEEAIRERRRAEAVLTAHGANAPNQRTTGLYATGGCSNSVRQRIEKKAAVLKAE